MDKADDFTRDARSQHSRLAAIARWNCGFWKLAENLVAMSTFSDVNLAKKLTDLNSSQQSILTLSLWLIHHRKHSKTIVEVWGREMKKGECPSTAAVSPESTSPPPHCRYCFRVNPPQYQLAPESTRTPLVNSHPRTLTNT